MYIKLNNGVIEKYPYSISEFRIENPNISLSSEPSSDSLLNHGLVAVRIVNKPIVDITKTVIEDTPIESNGVWTQQWKIVDATEQEINERKNEASAIAKSMRANAYREESDPLFFKAQRGESTMEEWAAKVAEIKSRYPKE